MSEFVHVAVDAMGGDNKTGQFFQDPAREIRRHVEIAGQRLRRSRTVQSVQEKIREVVSAQERIALLTGGDHFRADLCRAGTLCAPDCQRLYRAAPF